MLSKRESVKEFSAKELPIDAPTTVRQMLEQYQVPTLSLKGIFMDKIERGRVDLVISGLIIEM